MSPEMRRIEVTQKCSPVQWGFGVNLLREVASCGIYTAEAGGCLLHLLFVQTPCGREGQSTASQRAGREDKRTGSVPSRRPVFYPTKSPVMSKE